MGLFSETIEKREDNRAALEESADLSLLRNRQVLRIENEVDDTQTTALLILEAFGLNVDRVYGFRSVPSLLNTLLDPLGMMYDYTEDTAEHGKRKTEYILAYRTDGKSVALMPTVTGYRYICPGDSSRGLATKAFCERLRPGCYIFSRPLVEKKTVLRTFAWNVLHTLTVQDLFKILAATGLATGLGLVVPAVSRWVYRDYIGASAPAAGGFAAALLIYLFVIVARSGITLAKTLALSEIKIRVSLEMQSEVMAKVLHLPHSFFRNASAGKLSRRIGSCGRLSDIILEAVMEVLLNLTFSVAYLVQLRMIQPALFVPGLIWIGVHIGVSLVGAILNRRKEMRLTELDMEYTGLVYSSLRGIQKLKCFGAEVFVYSKWANMYRKKIALNYRQPFFLKYNTELLAAVSLLTTFFVLMAAFQNNLSAQDYLTFTSSLALIMTVVTGLTDIMNNLALTTFLCKNIEPIFAAGNEETEALEYIRTLQGAIRAEDLWFAYPGDSRGCLKGVSLSVRKGEKVAIVGESGCGKSTLLKLLIGLENPDRGTVYYDGKPMQSLNRKSLRRCIGSVFQFSKLIPATIAGNIAFGHEEYADEEKLWEAADLASIGDYIRTLPLKMETEVSETNSSGFSGGQRQRLLLARALLNRPSVLFLDEATSALDNVTQKQVLDNIGKLRSTVVMVAHRLSTVEGFDRIILLENGVIAEEGSYAELIRKNGSFARLVRKQMI